MHMIQAQRNDPEVHSAHNLLYLGIAPQTWRQTDKWQHSKAQPRSHLDRSEKKHAQIRLHKRGERSQLRPTFPTVI